MPFYLRYIEISFQALKLQSPGPILNIIFIFFSFSLQRVNQIGSVTESIEALKMSKRAGWGVIASHSRFEDQP